MDFNQLLRQSIIVHYIFAGSVTVIIYDRLITLDKEVKTIWTLPWGIPKILFFLNGYLTPAFLLFATIVTTTWGYSPSFCHAFAYWQALPTRLPLVVSQGLMITRLCAIYGNRLKFAIPVIVLYICEIVALTALVTLGTLQSYSQQFPPSTTFLPGCALIAESTHLRTYAIGTWAAPALLELIVVILTFFRLPFFHRKGNALIHTLARDSLIYFFFMFTFSFANMVIYVTSFDNNATILAGVSSAVACIAVSRMSMNIAGLSLYFNKEAPAKKESALQFNHSTRQQDTEGVIGVGNGTVPTDLEMSRITQQ